MPAYSTLTDNFDDNVRDTVKWSTSYGTVTEVGGRARVPVTTGYAAYQSAAAYTLAGSSVFLQMFPPAAGGTLVEAYCAISLTSGTDGTNIEALINAATGKLRLSSNTAYWDNANLTIDYNPVAHSWVRIAEAAGTLSWATSPDGLSWTVLRSIATPAWVTTSTTSSASLYTHRDAGTADYAEFDNFNVAPSVAPAPTVKRGAFLSFFAG